MVYGRKWEISLSPLLFSSPLPLLSPLFPLPPTTGRGNRNKNGIGNKRVLSPRRRVHVYSMCQMLTHVWSMCPDTWKTVCTRYDNGGTRVGRAMHLGLLRVQHVSAAYTRVQQVRTRGQYAFRVTTCKERVRRLHTCATCI